MDRLEIPTSALTAVKSLEVLDFDPKQVIGKDVGESSKGPEEKSTASKMKPFATPRPKRQIPKKPEVLRWNQLLPKFGSNIYTSADSAVFQTKANKACHSALVIFAMSILVLLLPLSLLFCFRIIREFERAVIFRLGRLHKGGCRGPGIIFICPCVDSYRKVDLRLRSFEVPPQEVLSKDSVTVSVDAVVYFRIRNPIVSVTNVSDASYSTKLLAQTTLRNILGTKTLEEMLMQRDIISQSIEITLHEATMEWGVKVERVEMKDIRLPNQLMRSMAAEAEASREARAKVISAKGEQGASEALRQAADILSDTPAALQLRFLQTLADIAVEHQSTIIYPVPVMMKTLLDH